CLEKRNVTMYQWSDFQLSQPVVARIVANSMKRNRFSHATLYDGEAGVVSTDLGRFISKLLLCTAEDAKPCMCCSNCKRIEKDVHPDVIVIRTEDRTMKKEETERLYEEANRTGVESNRKVFIIYEAEKMTQAAGNRLLKPIEEPVGDFYYLFFTSDANRVLGTIRSRCQTLSLLPLNKEEQLNNLLQITEHVRLATLAIEISSTFEGAKSLVESDWFAQARAIVLKLYEVQAQGREVTWLFLRKEWLPFFKEREQMEVSLRMLSVLYKDLLGRELDEHSSPIFGELEERENREWKQLGQKRRMEQLLAIHTAEKQLAQYVQSQTVMEQLMTQLQEG
ncbi:MAG: hypothetical protein ACRC5C_11940, partial [Bacilli bacterium]